MLFGVSFAPPLVTSLYGYRRKRLFAGRLAGGLFGVRSGKSFAGRDVRSFGLSFGSLEYVRSGVGVCRMGDGWPYGVPAFRPSGEHKWREKVSF